MKSFLAAALLFVFSCITFWCPTQAFALAKFNTSYQVYYRVDPTGNTHVTFWIKQSNNLSVVYATDFGISINETNVSNVKVTDEGVPVKPEVNKTFNQTSISFPFANKIVGKDKVHSFTIEYDTTDIASKFGNTWQINIPRLEADENVSEQTAILTVPDGFPAPAYIDPKPDMVSDNNYYFNSKKLSNKSISAIFGTTQYYEGNLTYHLSNETKELVSTEIALPPDTAYQTSFVKSISPTPENVRMDEDGNWLAAYSLKPSSKIKIEANMVFKIEFNPKPSTHPPLDSYTLPTKIWNYEDSFLNTSEINNLKSPKTIYDYVADKMIYDYGKITQKKLGQTTASDSLRNHQSAICTDFTNVYIALARKAGIPTREIQGFAISDNPDLKPLSLSQDVLHAWPEYYDHTRRTWIQIDPTWTNTTRGVDYFNKLDFNHIAFVIHGKDPGYPIPAGGYKDGATKTKDIDIRPIPETKFPEPTIEINYIKQEKDTLYFLIKNTSGVAFSEKVSVSEGGRIQGSDQIIKVPPYGTSELVVQINNMPFISQKDIPVIIDINGVIYRQSVSISGATNQIGILSGIGGVLVITSITAWGLHLRRQKQKPTLYR